MKRRTRLIIIGCAIAGTFPAAAQAASATPNAGSEFRPVEPANLSNLTLSASTSARPPVRATTTALVSEAPPRVHAPVLRVTVKPGDTLSAIGARTSRTWEQLASYNHIPNPNLIYVDQVFTIPPRGYVPTSPVVLPVAQVRPTPVVTHYSAPVVHSTPVHYSAPAPSYSSGFQACVAWRESGNGSGSSNIYGILNSTWASLGRSGSAYTASRAEQDAAFAQLYAEDGSRPWAPYDGC
jgi:LysM repeat protein